MSETRKEEALSRAAGRVARNYVPENNSGYDCGVGPALLTLADRVALVEAGIALVHATPPTPDRAAVREALVLVLQSASLKSVDNLDDVLGSRHTAKFEDTADALLAAVSRPAESRGEPVATMMKRGQSQSVAWDADVAARLPDGHHQLYTHPAPSGGEAYSKRVVRDEPGVTEIHVEARQVLRDGPMRVECWWSEEDGAYIASLTDDEERGRPFAATHTGIGATREEALAHLAVAEYVTALAVAAPRPEPGAGDV